MMYLPPFPNSSRIWRIIRNMEKVKLLPGSEDYSKNSVNAAKVTDHHALLITENAAIGLFKDEKIVYDMILCRMIEAFSADCIKDITSVSAQRTAYHSFWLHHYGGQDQTEAFAYGIHIACSNGDRRQRDRR